MMIAFITIKSSLVPLIEGLCAQIYFRFEISVVGQTYLLESIFSNPVRQQLGISASGDWRILCRVSSIKSYMCTCVSGLSLLI